IGKGAGRGKRGKSGGAALFIKKKKKQKSREVSLNRTGAAGHDRRGLGQSERLSDVRSVRTKCTLEVSEEGRWPQRVISIGCSVTHRQYVAQTMTVQSYLILVVAEIEHSIVC